MIKKKVVTFRSAKQAQFSIEYMVMMGFALLLLLPTILLFATEKENIKSDIAASQATQIARKIADKAEEIYYQGAPSRTTLKVYMPRGVESITFSNREVVISFRTSANVLSDIVEVTPVNITGSISPASGIHYIEIKSEGDYILVSET